MKRSAGKNNNFIIILFLFLIFTLLVVLMNGKTIRETFMNSTQPTSEKNVNVYIEYYYAPECGHCKEFNATGVWGELEKMSWKHVELKKYEMALREDSTTSAERKKANERANKFNISSVPTIIAVDAKSDLIIKSFSGERTLDALKGFINMYENPPSAPATASK